MKGFKAILVAAAIVVPAASATAASKDMLAAAADAGKLSTLLKAVDAAGLTDKLKGPGPYTLFAPSDEAFARIDAESMADLLDPANREELVGLLKAHMVPGALTADDLAGKQKSLGTVASTEIRIDGSSGVRAGEATIVSTVRASNGVIHIVDRVIEPDL